MGREQPHTLPETVIDAGIDALLGGAPESSIVDSLFALPDPAADTGVAGEWETAVSASLQKKLARALREAIESGRPSEDAARDAA